MRDNLVLDQISADIKSILEKALNAEDISENEALKLLKVNKQEFIALQQVADSICRMKTKDIVTFIINQNINFTNICYQGCKFCSYSVPRDHKDAYLLSIENIKQKVNNACINGCTEICIQGGINPDVPFEYYTTILNEIKNINPKVHIHAYSPQEVWHLSQISNHSIERVMQELKKAGLDSMPGTAAEILSDDIRKIICPNKITTDQWIDIIKKAHKLGIPTTSTIMYGHIEKLEHRIIHLSILREIQRETHGFTEFVPLPYVKDNPILSKLKNVPIKDCYGMDDLKLFCVTRLFLNNYIDNIQCSWVKLGPRFAQVSLNYGVNDFSGTLMEENISRSAGARFGEFLNPDEIIRIINSAGKKPAQRDTLYNILKYY
jgi:FO synthase subunit 2